MIYAKCQTKIFYFCTSRYMRCNYRDLNTILRLISKASIDNKDLLNVTV